MEKEKTVKEIALAQHQLRDAIKLLCDQFHENNGLYPMLNTVIEEQETRVGKFASYKIEVKTIIE